MTDASTVVSVLVMLALCGFLYDRYVVDIIERKLPPLGITAYEVVGGVLFTLVGSSFLIGLEATLLVLLCFAASGIPMIIGARARYLDRND